MYKELVDGVVAERGFITHFSEEEEKLAAEAAVADRDLSTRVDYRDRELITIDDENARDFDDAVGCRSLPDGRVLLTVAIADVSTYVAAGSPLDAAARQRGNSVYLPDRVIPMLPETLSNDACSLQPQKDRLGLCCQMQFTVGGELERYRFFSAIIRSAKRMNYDEAAALMHGDIASDFATPTLLWQIAKGLRQQRQQRGGMLLEVPERYCTIDGDGKLHTGSKNRNIAHWAIEEAMIAANRCTADFLIQHHRPALHRIHAKPSAEKVKQLANTLMPLGIALPQQPTAADFAAALAAAEARDKTLFEALTPLVLGTLARAEYVPDEKTGHFGLACERYTHFTSPIRRYPDLLTHRALIAAMNNDDSPYAAGELAGIGAHCGETEITADKAGWDSRQRLLCIEVQKMIGCEYEGYVSGILANGFFVTVADLGIDGMVRLAALPGYWKSDTQKKIITSPDGATTIAIGNKIDVKLTSVLPEKGRVDLTLCKHSIG